MKCMLLLATGYEECEALLTIDLLRRANIHADLISTETSLVVIGGHNITVKADALLGDINTKDYQALILPGGMPGVSNLQQNPDVIKLVLEFNQANKQIFAICAAPSILIQAGLLKELPYTCYPGFEDLVKAPHYKDEGIIVTEHITTAKALGSGINFALAIISKLDSKKTATSVQAAIYYEGKI